MTEKEDLVECFTCGKFFPRSQIVEVRRAETGTVWSYCGECRQKIADAKKKKLTQDLAQSVLELKKPPEEMTANELDAVITHYQEEAKATRWMLLVAPVLAVFWFIFVDFRGYILPAFVIALAAGVVGPTYYGRKAEKYKRLAKARQSTKSSKPP